MNDDNPLVSIRHPRPNIFKRIYQSIKAIFIRPKFSKESLEPAESTTDGGALDNFGIK